MHALASRWTAAAVLAAALGISCGSSDDTPPPEGNHPQIDAAVDHVTPVPDAGKEEAAATEDAGSDVSVSPPDGGEVDAGADVEAGVTGLEQVAPYPQVVFPPENQPLAKDADKDLKSVLGKILFWEEQIGGNNAQACGSCHRSSPGGGSDPRASEPESLGVGPDGITGTPDDVHGGRGIPRCGD